MQVKFNLTTIMCFILVSTWKTNLIYAATSKLGIILYPLSSNIHSSTFIQLSLSQTESVHFSQCSQHVHVGHSEEGGRDRPTNRYNYTDASSSRLNFITKYMIIIPGGYLVLVRQPACMKEHSWRPPWMEYPLALVRAWLCRPLQDLLSWQSPPRWRHLC